MYVKYSMYVCMYIQRFLELESYVLYVCCTYSTAVKRAKNSCFTLDHRLKFLILKCEIRLCVMGQNRRFPPITI